MDWETSATLGSNPNLGSWAGTPSYNNSLLQTDNPITGSHSMGSNGNDLYASFATWQPGTGDFTLELTFRPNGTNLPPVTQTSPSADLLTLYDAGAARKAFLLTLKGDGSDSHVLGVVMTEDGSTNQSWNWNLKDLGAEVSTIAVGTGYHVAVERNGANLSLYLGLITAASQTRVTMNRVGASIDLGAGFDVFDSSDSFRIGKRQNGSSQTMHGRYDNFRLVNAARFEAAASKIIPIPHPRTAEEAAELIDLAA